MKATILKISSFILFFIIMGTGCKKESKYIPDPHPVKAIIGKWVCIEAGGFPVEEPTQYIEYFPDGIRKIYNYKTKAVQRTEEYWIDSLLFIGPKRDASFLSEVYYYQFYNDQLKLNYHHVIGEIDFFIYKRIK